MCGFLIVVGPAAENPKLALAVSAGLDAIKHRGPDGSGVVHGAGAILGHRRLSIIDLSEAGAQPMTDPASGATIIFNGEIYNYLEIRDELADRGYEFRSNSDTEVLLKAYIEWGADCLRRLNGMFAFAILDPHKHKVFLARDRFGVKPLYFAERYNYFAAASEPKALIRAGLASQSPDDAAVSTFLSAGHYAAGEDTFYRDVHSVPAAHYVIVDTNSLQRTSARYWEYPKPKSGRVSEAGAVAEEFSSLLTSAIDLRLRSDVPVGLSLSGGLDSTAVLSGAATVRRSPPICFTSTYDKKGVDELAWAKLASDRAGATLIACEATSQNWWQTLENCIYHLDSPVTQSAVIPVWHLMRAVRERGIKVLLEGQGADELLGGYEQYAAHGIISDITRPSRWRRAPSSISHGLQLFGPTTLVYTMLKILTPSAIRGYRLASGHTGLVRSVSGADRAEEEIQGTLLQHSQGRTGADLRFWLDHSSTQLPRLLHYGDAISMAHGIETRMPFMDYRLVEFAFSLPVDTRLDSAQSKWLVRDYLKRHGQMAIAQRTDKKGYPTPYSAWISELGRSDIDARFPASSPTFQYVHRERFLAKLRAHAADQTSLSNMLFRIVTLDVWLNRQMTHTDQLSAVQV